MKQSSAIFAIFLMFGTFIGLRHGTVLAQEDGGSWDTRGPDGHYHNPNTGEVMDEQCNMHHDNPHPCHCNRSDPDESCDPSKPQQHPSDKCRTYCRTGDCHCQPDCPS